MARTQTGSNSYSGKVSSSPITGGAGTEWTMALFFKAADTSTNFIPFSCQNTAADGANSASYLELGGAVGVIPVAVYYGSAAPGVASSASTYTTNWGHICGTFTGNTARSVYINGAGKATNSDSPAAASTLDMLIIGGYVFGGTALANMNGGIMASAAIWDAVLTDAEVLALAFGAHPYTIKRANLRFYAPLSGVRDPEIDTIGQLSLTTNGSSAAEATPGQIRGGWRW